jgi:hypothetical protein
MEVLCSRLRRTDEHIAEPALPSMPVRLAKAGRRLTTAARNHRGCSAREHQQGLLACQRQGIVRIKESTITICRLQAGAIQCRKLSLIEA